MVDDFEFVDYGALAWADTFRDIILIDNFNRWIESFVETIIAHETMHCVLRKIENEDVSVKFDNLFGFIDCSVILTPEDRSMYRYIQYKRIENLWERLTKK